MNKECILKHLFILLFLTSLQSFSQTTIKGKTTSINDSIVPFVNVILEQNNKIVSYTYSNENGDYSLETGAVSGVYQLSFSALSYQKKVTPVTITTKSSLINFNAILKDEAYNLDEVIIATEKAITIKKDTIIFNVAAFKKGNEEVVQDLLKNLPGIEVGDDGVIKVGDKEVEKVMIEGDDFFEKGYRVLTKSMSSQSIDKVEILQHYSNNRLLKGIEESDKVALNLKLKDDAKREWFGDATITQGISPQNRYEAKANLINLGKKNKYYFLTNLNSIGNNPINDLNSLVTTANLDDPSSVGDNQNLSTINTITATVPGIRDNRVNFNNAELLSLNAIFNPTDKIKIRTLGFYSTDTRDFFKKNITQFSFESQNFTNTENFQLRNKENKIFGKLDVTYEISKNKRLELTTKYNNSDEKITTNLLFNGASTIQKLANNNLLLDQKIIFTNKFDKKKVLLVTGRYINEKLPQQYTNNQFLFQDTFSNSKNADNLLQTTKNNMNFTGLEVHLLNRQENKNLFELQLGNEYRKDNLLTRFSIKDGTNILTIPEDFQNNTKYATNDTYLKSRYLISLNKVEVIGEMELHQLVTIADFIEDKKTDNPFFINPSFTIKCEINESNKFTGSYSYNNTKAKTVDIYNNFSLNDFRSFTKGLGAFKLLNTSSTNLQYQLGDWSDDFFANISALHIKNHDFISTNSTISQNIDLIEKIIIKDRNLFNITTNADRFIDLIRANVRFNFSYTHSNFKNIVNDSDLRNVTSKNLSYGLELRSGFKGVFNYHLGTKWLNTSIISTISNSYTNNLSFLDASFVINPKLYINVETERYYFGNLAQSTNTYYFLDINSKYKIVKNKLSLTFQARNLFNTKVFRNSTISDTSTSNTEYRFLPRFLLLGAKYVF